MTKEENPVLVSKETVVSINAPDEDSVASEGDPVVPSACFGVTTNLPAVFDVRPPIVTETRFVPVPIVGEEAVVAVLKRMGFEYVPEATGVDVAP
jgi:hypothetical protein